jgi:cofilin
MPLQVDGAIAENFKALNMKRAHRFMIVKISEDQSQATLEHCSDRSATFADFKAAMPANEPRYAIYDLEYKTKDGRNESKLVFIMYSPDSCPPGQIRFVYAQNKEEVKAKMSPVHKELQINDIADLNEAEWIEDFQ